MKHAFDVIETITKQVAEFRETMGFEPHSIVVSPTAYRRLVEARAWEGCIGNLIIGCSPLRTFEMEDGEVPLVIDETLGDMVAEVK